MNFSERSTQHCCDTIREQPVCYSLLSRVILWLLGGSLSLILAIAPATAQNYQNYHLGLKEGLPTYFTKSINQDSLGFIWIASDAGVVRYDGSTFKVYKDKLTSLYTKKVYKNNNGTLITLSDQGIYKIIHEGNEANFEVMIEGNDEPADSTVYYPRDIYQGSNGDYWISEPRGISRYSPQENKLHRYTLPESLHSTSYTHSFYVFERAGQIYCLSYNDGKLFNYQKGKDSFEPFISNSPFNNSWVEDYELLPNGDLLATGQRGIYKLSYKADTYSRNWTLVSGIDNATALTSNKGRLFIGTTNGRILKSTADSIQSHPKPIATTKVQGINELFVDRFGTLWASSDQGVIFLNQTMFTPLDYPTSIQRTNAMSRAGKGGIYTAVQNRIFKWSAGNSTPTASKKLFEVEDKNVWSLAFDDTYVWAGTGNGNVFRWDGDRLKKYDLKEQANIQSIQHSVFSLRATSSGKGVWATIQEDVGVLRINEDETIDHFGTDSGLDYDVLTFNYDEADTFYVAGRGEDLPISRFNPDTHQFTRLTVSNSSDFEIDNILIHDFSFGNDDHIYMATDQGIFVYKPTSSTQGILKRIEAFKEVENSLIRSIHTSDTGHIWVGTEYGLYLYAYKDLVKIDLSDGLPNTTLTYRSLIPGAEGSLWVGTHNGIGYLSDLTETDKSTPPPLLNKLTIDGKTRNYSSNLSIVEGSNTTFEFTSLVFPDNKVNYQYRIPSLSDNWQNYSQRSLYSTSDLSAGKYTIEIRAHFPGLQPSSVSEYNFTISLPWYKSWYAILIYALFGLGAGWLIYNSRHNVKQKQITEEQLRRTEQHLSTIIANTPLVLFVINQHGILTLLEGRVLKSMNITPSKMLGKPIHELRDLWIGKESFQQALSGKPVEYTQEIEGLTLSTQLNPLYNQNNTISGVIGLSTDITYRKHIEQELRKAKERAESANTAKTTFLANMSHELRTPLNAIIGYSQILMNEQELKHRHKDQLRVVHNSGEHLLGMINDILDLTRIESGNLSVNHERFDLKQFLDDLYKMFTLRARNKNLSLKMEIAQSVPGIVITDQYKLRQILINIISNAIKYTNEGEISIQVDHATDGANPSLKFEIADTGVGIPDEQVENIFKPFRQIDRTSTEGSGLGLAITNNLIELLEGKLDMNSQVDQGTTFHITIPYTPDHQEQTLFSQKADKEGNSGSAIDDNYQEIGNEVAEHLKNLDPQHRARLANAIELMDWNAIGKEIQSLDKKHPVRKNLEHILETHDYRLLLELNEQIYIDQPS